MAPAVLNVGPIAVRHFDAEPTFVEASVLIGPKQLNLVRNGSVLHAHLLKRHHSQDRTVSSNNSRNNAS
jgi:hypothetical protein